MQWAKAQMSAYLHYLYWAFSVKPWWLSWMRVRLVIRRLRVQPLSGWHYSFVEIDHEIFSTLIFSLPLIQEGQLSVSGERMCTILVNHLEEQTYPIKVWLGELTVLDMTPLGWLGGKTSTQTNKQRNLQHQLVLLVSHSSRYGAPFSQQKNRDIFLIPPQKHVVRTH